MSDVVDSNFIITWSFRGNTYKFPVEKIELEDKVFSVTIKELQLVSKSEKSYEDAYDRMDGPLYGLFNYLEANGRLNEIDRFIDGVKKPYYAPNREFLGTGSFDGVDGFNKYTFPVKVFKDFDFFLVELPELKIKGYSRTSAQEAFDLLKQSIIYVFQRPDLYDKENIRQNYIVISNDVPEIVIDNDIPPIEQQPQGEVGNL